MTAELALALPAVVVLLVAVLTLGAASTAQMRAADAARAGARAVAVGEDPAAAVRQVGGPAAQASVTHDGAWVTVRVSAPVVGWLGGLPLRASGTATAWQEP